MNLLAIDTSTPRATLALVHCGVLHSRLGESPSSGGRHGRDLVPEIDRLLRSAGLTPRDLDAIAVGLGPGSYTGLRVGVTAAKTIAFTLAKPLASIDSFAAIARNAAAGACLIHVVADAQRGDVYLTRFAREAVGEPIVPLEPITIVAMTTWAATLQPGTWVLGPALDRLRVTWPAGVLLGTADDGQPSARALIDLGMEAVQSERWVDPDTIEPLYVRRSAAEDQWDLRRMPS